MPQFLSIIWYKVLPAQYGGQKGIARFNQYLGERVQLTAICSKDNTTDAPISYNILSQLPLSKTQFINPRVRSWIKNYLEKHSFTHIILEHPYHAWIGKLKKQLGFKLIVHAHNIEYLRMQQRKKWWWPWVKYTEAKAFRYADFILFKTEKDKILARQLFLVPEHKCVIVPYGIEKKEPPVFSPLLKVKIKLLHHINPDERIILFAGTPGYEPNIIALENIKSKILPALRLHTSFKFRILICGKHEPDTIDQFSIHPEVIFTGFVDSMDEYMQAADVFINPVISGSGIQTKNIDAIANGLSVAATNFAATGLPLYVRGNKLLVCEEDNWNQFAENIINLSAQNKPTPFQFYDEFFWGNIIDRTLARIL